MRTEDIKAVDVHVHVGKFSAPIGSPVTREPFDSVLGGSPEVVLKRAKLSNTEVSVICPYIAALGYDSFKGNEEAVKMASKEPSFLHWAFYSRGVRKKKFQPEIRDQVLELISSPKCAGIKIHAEFTHYDLEDKGDFIFGIAAMHHAVIAVDSGASGTKPSTLSMFANRYPEMKMILTYLGRAHDIKSYGVDFQIRAIQGCKHKNMFVDTASKRTLYSGVIEYAVKEIGAEHILYGSDSPNYFAPAMRARIDKAEISDDAKCLILRDNAVKLFGLREDENGWRKT